MSHQDRRDPLPKGYQFGDAGRTEPEFVGLGDGIPSWSVVDGKLMRLPRVVRVVVRQPDIAIRYTKQWDITPDPAPTRRDDWNVIEGEEH